MRQTNELMFVELAWLPATEDVIPECRLELVSDVLVFMKLAMRMDSGRAGYQLILSNFSFKSI